MFNVSALLLDDALNPATPVSNGAINETLRYGAFARHKVMYRHVSGVVKSDSVIINFFPNSDSKRSVKMR